VRSAISKEQHYDAKGTKTSQLASLSAATSVVDREEREMQSRWLSLAAYDAMEYTEKERSIQVGIIHW
jgi:hypothetical protein